MKKKISLFQQNPKELFFAIGLIAMSFLLLGNLITGIFTSLISLILSLILLSKIDLAEKQYQHKRSSYSFFLAFLKGIEDNVGVTSAYESASRYLLGFQEVIVFDQLSKENSLELYEYQSHFDFIIEKDKLNEANMMFYRPLIDTLKDKLNTLESKRRKIKDNFCFTYLILLTLCFVLSINTSYINMEDVFSNSIYSIGSMLIFTLLSPSYHFCYWYSLKGI